MHGTPSWKSVLDVWLQVCHIPRHPQPLPYFNDFDYMIPTNSRLIAAGNAYFWEHETIKNFGIWNNKTIVT